MLTPQGFTTRIIHNPYAKEDINRALIQPIYSNATFDFESAEQMELAFQGRFPAHSYSRISNPTVENLELRVKEITGSLNVTALSSGMAAISNTILLLASAGSNIIISRYLFGNTYLLITSTMKEYGIESRFCDLNNTAEVIKAIDSKTIAVFVETITNPQLEVVDLLKLSAAAHDNNVPLLADSTLTPPNVFRAKELGVDIEIISSTKCFSGGATSTGGLIVDYGSFDWGKSTKLAPLAKRFGPMAFNYKLRREIFRNFGSCMSPFAAYFQSLGLETLQLRFEKAVSNCVEIARLLTGLPEVRKVNYPGIKGSAYYEVSRRQFGDFPGALLTFDLESREACFAFMNRLNIIKRATNLYDNKTLIIHPASTIYCDFDAAELMSLSVNDTTLRLSAGIEDTEDLKNDILEAINI
jgi:O-acetylhomoserine (thiol)-lyase